MDGYAEVVHKRAWRRSLAISSKVRTTSSESPLKRDFRFSSSTAQNPKPASPGLGAQRPFVDSNPYLGLKPNAIFHSKLLRWRPHDRQNILHRIRLVVVSSRFRPAESAFDYMPCYGAGGERCKPPDLGCCSQSRCSCVGQTGRR